MCLNGEGRVVPFCLYGGLPLRADTQVRPYVGFWAVKCVFSGILMGIGLNVGSMGVLWVGELLGFFN